VRAPWGLAVALAACVHQAKVAPNEALHVTPPDADVDARDDAAEEVDAGGTDASARNVPMLVAKIDGVVSLAVDGTNVYALSHLDTKWRLWRVSTSGGTPVALDDYFAKNASFAVDDEHVYVATAARVDLPMPHGIYAMSAYGRVVAAPKGGGARHVLFDAPFAATGVVTWSGDAYWLSGKLRGPGEFVLESVLRAPATHGAVSDIAIGQYGASSVAVDASGIYWSVEGVPDARTHVWRAGKIVRAGAARGSTAVLATTAPRPHAVTLDGDAIYFVADGAKLARVAKSGGGVTAVADGVVAYVVDSAFVWWASDHAVAWRSKSSDASVATLHVDDSVGAIALDAERIYYATPTAVWRVTKAIATK
jgi:hypothetical protein